MPGLVERIEKETLSIHHFYVTQDCNHNSNLYLLINKKVTPGRIQLCSKSINMEAFKKCAKILTEITGLWEKQNHVIGRNFQTESSEDRAEYSAHYFP